MMLRLSILRNLNFLTKTLTTNVDQPNLVRHLPVHLKQSSNVNHLRQFSLSSFRLCEANESENAETEEKEEEEVKLHKLYRKYAGTQRDRTKVIPVETSIEYLQSPAYKSTYGDRKVWELYRRIHKGQLPKSKTRKTCIRGGVIAVGSPCPICRDEYLVLNYQNLVLLKQFISPHTGEVRPKIFTSIPYPYTYGRFKLQILSYSRTGLCQKQHTRLIVNIERAYDLGLLEYQVPFREYNYADYYDVYKKPLFKPKLE